MITLSILAFFIALIIGVGISIATLGGAAFILLFGDVAVCAAIIGLIVYLITKKKK